MNLIEAIKSGRPFRSPSQCINWVQPRQIGYQLQIGYQFDWAQLTATDWEIQEPTVTITAVQLFRALWEANKELIGAPVGFSDVLRRTATKLGLEEP